MTDKVTKTDAEWQAQLSPEEYYVTREKGTERAFSGKYHNATDPGTYSCVCCDQDLFDSNEKFESGTGWPSFWQPVEPGAVITEEDRSFGMLRTELCVLNVMRIWAMCFQTARNQLACATASIP